MGVSVAPAGHIPSPAEVSSYPRAAGNLASVGHLLFARSRSRRPRSVAEAKARLELGSVPDAIVSWDTGGGQTQPREVALGLMLDYA
jgi:hypothetical protein